jgi:hypothetical protein
MPALTFRSARVALVTTAWLALAAAGALAEDRPALRIPRAPHPPVLADYVDGRVEPPGIKVTGFVQREPGDGVASSLDTTAYLSYDAQHLYAVFVCKDDPTKVRANLTKREAINSDDIVGVIVDTYDDGRRSYLFLVNPLGIQRDGVTSEGQEDDYSYDTLWSSDGRLTADGYMVSIAIPFRSLRFRSEDVQTWRIALGRIIPRTNETVFWPYITRRIASVGQQMATLEGISGASPGKNLQAIPYGSFATARFVDDDGRRVSDGTGRIGVDAKAVIKDAVTVDLTVNPDFSQIESDEPQVTINQRFEVFFPEKRPFFIENASYFETPQNVFFSRRIADPGAGGRVTGKSRGWAFGALVASDEQPGREVSPGTDGYDDLAGAVVFRAQREFKRQSYVGGIFTDREFGSTANRVYGADGRWRFDDNWSATGQWIGSTTEDEIGSAHGSSVVAQVQREGRAFNYEGQYLSRSPEFRADLGFIPRVDLREVANEASYRWYPKNRRRLLSARGELETNVLWSYGGDLEEWTVEPALEVEFPGQTVFGVRQWTSYERFAGIDFRPVREALYADTAWLDWLSTSVFWRWGTAINYYPPEGLAPFLADLQEVEAGVTLRPTSRLRLDETYLFSSLTVGGDSPLPSHLVGADIFNNHIVRSRVNYQFTKRLSTRLIVDYVGVLPNEALVSLEREKRLAFDVLATYMVNPWTAVYAGYTDAYANLLEDPLGRPVTRGGAPTTSVGRQLFVKVSYLLKY